jgi:hypothetical protein
MGQADWGHYHQIRRYLIGSVFHAQWHIYIKLCKFRSRPMAGHQGTNTMMHHSINLKHIRRGSIVYSSVNIST